MSNAHHSLRTVQVTRYVTPLREGGSLPAIDRICKGEKESGPIGQLDMASRFRWLTARRSTIVQTSDVHPGLCEQPAETLDRLFNQLVL